MAKYQSKTYSLSDEVVAAIEKAKQTQGLTPNRYLLALIRTAADVEKLQTAAQRVGKKKR